MSDREIEEIKAVQKKWEEKNQEKFRHERKKEFVSTDGVPIKRVYMPTDLKEKNFDYLTDLNLPGEYPFTRGIDPTMYRTKFFQLGQLSGESSPEENNKLWKNLIAHGNEHLHCCFDLPTLLGHNSDEPEVFADVGKVGVAVDSLEDMEIMFSGIDIGKCPATLISSSGMAMAVFAMFLATAEKQGYKPEQLSGVVQNDIFTGYGAGGTYCFPPSAGLRMATDILTYCAKYMPNYYPCNISSHHWEEAGANRILQIAVIMSSLIQYIKEALKRGVDVDDIGPKIMYVISIDHQDFLTEIAKVRAMRRLHARIMKERFGAKNPASLMFRTHSKSGGSNYTTEPMELNIGRNAIAMLGHALAGVTSVAGTTWDEPLGIPSQRASIAAIRTIQMVAHECGVTDTVDPLAGSYYVEYFTSELEGRAAEVVNKIDDMGGMLEAITSGYVQHELTKSAYELQNKFESGELVKLGLNMFRDDTKEERRDFYKPNLAVLESQKAKLKALRQRRDNEKVKQALAKLQACARKEPTGENNLVFPMLNAVKAYATEGEIRRALEEVFGYYPPPTAI